MDTKIGRLWRFATSRGLVVLFGIYSIVVTTISISLLAFVLGVDRLYWPGLVIQILGLSATIFTITLSVSSADDRDSNAAFAFANAIAVLPGLTSAILGSLVTSAESSKITESVIFDIMAASTKNPLQWSVIICLLLLFASWGVAYISARQLRSEASTTADLTIPSVFILSVQVVLLDQWVGADIETTTFRAILALVSFCAAMWIASWLFINFLRKARDGFISATIDFGVSVGAFARFSIEALKTLAALAVHTLGLGFLAVISLLVLATASNLAGEFLVAFIGYLGVQVLAPFGDTIWFMIALVISVQPVLAILKSSWFAILRSNLLGQSKAFLRWLILGIMFIASVAAIFAVIFLVFVVLRSLFEPNGSIPTAEGPPAEVTESEDPPVFVDAEENEPEENDKEDLPPPLQAMRVVPLEIRCAGEYTPLNWVNGSWSEVSSDLFRCEFDPYSVSPATRAVIAVGMASPGLSEDREITRARRRAQSLARWMELESQEIQMLALNLGMRISDDAPVGSRGFETRGERPIVVWTVDAVPSQASASRDDVLEALREHLATTKIGDVYSSCELFDGREVDNFTQISWDCDEALLEGE